MGNEATTIIKETAVLITCPILFNIERKPLAMPLLLTGTEDIIIVVFGTINSPEPTKSDLSKI